MSETATTVHGEVSYETVTCASCENELAKEECERFVIGTVDEIESWSYRGTVEYEFEDTTVRDGWVCPYCRTDPAAYPTDMNNIVWRAYRDRPALAFVASVMLALALIFALVVIA